MEDFREDGYNAGRGQAWRNDHHEPPQWDAFESVKWSMDTTHKISAVFFPQRNEVEATWENIATGKTAGATFPVTPDQGEDIAELIMPCVYHDAACEPPEMLNWRKIRGL